MLELRSIDAGYSTHPVLRQVDLTVPDRSVVALLGPNGAGKTTLLRVASGLLAPTAGTMWHDGEDVTTWSPDRLARAGLCHIPEGRGIFRGLSVRDNLRLQARGSAATAADVLTAFPRLGERQNQRAGTLSGGEQQMLALSHAYLPGTRVALLDEVSMGLAPRIVDEIYAFLRRLVAGGSSLLLVEQYVGRALELADYVYILRKGRIEFAGEPRQLSDQDLRDAYFGG